MLFRDMRAGVLATRSDSIINSFYLTVSRRFASGSGDCYLKSQNSGPVQTTSQTDCESQKAGLRLHQ